MTSQCGYCGGPLPLEGVRPGPKRIYCSPQCKTRRWTQQQYADRPSASSRVYLGRRGTEEECFWVKVQKSETCWTWVGGGCRGYGQFRNVRAHRWAYEHLVGQIPEGMVLDHLCGHRDCVNPSHLEPVTVAENNRRARISRGSHGAEI